MRAGGMSRCTQRQKRSPSLRIFTLGDGPTDTTANQGLSIDVHFFGWSSFGPVEPRNICQEMGA